MPFRAVIANYHKCYTGILVMQSRLFSLKNMSKFHAFVSGMLNGRNLGDTIQFRYTSQIASFFAIDFVEILTFS
jgi:hypothetical protein